MTQEEDAPDRELSGRSINRFLRVFLARLGWSVGTGLGSGLFPLAPATFASLVALAAYFIVPLTGDSLGPYLLIGIGFPVGVWPTGTLIGPANSDPKKAVWDE